MYNTYQLKTALEANIKFKDDQITALYASLVTGGDADIKARAMTFTEISILSAEKAGYENSLKLVHAYSNEN